MFRMFAKERQRLPAETLAGHLKERIEEDYILSSGLTKWVDWIGRSGVNRARVLVDYLAQQEDTGVSDVALAMDLIVKMWSFKKRSYFEDSKNLRVLVANEMCRYMEVDMGMLRRAVSEETVKRMTPYGLLQDARYIEAEVALQMLKAKIDEQPALRFGQSN